MMGSKVILSLFLWNLITFFTLTSSQVQRTFTVTNKCTQDVYFASNIPNYAGFRMTPGYTTSFPVSGTFNGRAWGQTGCTFDSNNNPISCQVCNNGAVCTLAEFNLGGWDNIDFYDISLVDGYALSTSITTNIASASGFNCGNPVCTTSFSKCPPELLLYNADGSINSCQNVCNAVNNAAQVAKFPILNTVKSQVLTCCGTRDTTVCGPNTWPVSSNGLNYYQILKQQCTTSYAYPDDDSSSTFTCTAQYPNFVITFCPAGGSGTGAAPAPAPTAAPTTTKAPTAAPTTTKAPTTAAPTPKPTSPPASGTCATSYAHVRCFGLGGGATQSSQAACAAVGCASGSSSWSWNAIGGACWTGTVQYCVADSGINTDGSAQWFSGGAGANINTCQTSLPHTRCWGLGGGAVQASAAACAAVGCASGSTAWSWNAQGGACWTGTPQYCNPDTSVMSDGTAEWFAGGALTNVQSEQAVVGSSTWFKQKGYWIVVAIVILILLIGVVLYLTFRTRNRGNSFEAPEKAPTAATSSKPADVPMTTTAGSGEEQMLTPTPETDAQVSAATPWVQRKDEGGNSYYYNEKTGASQWETPDV